MVVKFFKKNLQQMFDASDSACGLDLNGIKRLCTSMVIDDVFGATSKLLKTINE